MYVKCIIYYLFYSTNTYNVRNVCSKSINIEQNEFTLITRMKAMAASPKYMSPFLRSWKCSISFSMMSFTVSPLNRTPKMPFNCDSTIIMEVAVVKPEVTGVEIKSTKNPENQ